MAVARAHKPLLFEQVAARMRDAIHAGILAAGDRLPSVRELSQQERVSISTVLQAYQQLEAWDLVEARPQSGHYVRLLRRPPPQEPPVSRPPSSAREPSVAELVRRMYMAAGNERIVNLGSARPSSKLLPTRKLSRLIAALAREAGGVGIEYDMPPGWPALRQQLARRSLAWGCQLGPDDFVTTIGAAEAVHLSLLATCSRGDIVAVESPAYYGTLQVLEMLELRALEMPTHPREGMQLDALEAALKKQPIKAVLVVTNFSNPLGGCMPDEKKEALVRDLRARRRPAHRGRHLRRPLLRPCPSEGRQELRPDGERAVLLELLQDARRGLPRGLGCAGTVPGAFRAVEVRPDGGHSHPPPDGDRGVPAAGGL